MRLQHLEKKREFNRFFLFRNCVESQQSRKTICLFVTTFNVICVKQGPIEWHCGEQLSCRCILDCSSKKDKVDCSSRVGRTCKKLVHCFSLSRHRLRCECARCIFLEIVAGLRLVFFQSQTTLSSSFVLSTFYIIINKWERERETKQSRAEQVIRESEWTWLQNLSLFFSYEIEESCDGFVVCFFFQRNSLVVSWKKCPDSVAIGIYCARNESL